MLTRNKVHSLTFEWYSRPLIRLFASGNFPKRPFWNSLLYFEYMCPAGCSRWVFDNVGSQGSSAERQISCLIFTRHLTGPLRTGGKTDDTSPEKSQFVSLAYWRSGTPSEKFVVWNIWLLDLEAKTIQAHYSNWLSSTSGTHCTLVCHLDAQVFECIGRHSSS